jgi:hypothetical protein
MASEADTTHRHPTRATCIQEQLASNNVLHPSAICIQRNTSTPLDPEHPQANISLARIPSFDQAQCTTTDNEDMVFGVCNSW